MSFNKLQTSRTNENILIKITIRLRNPYCGMRIRILVHKLADIFGFGFGLPALKRPKTDEVKAEKRNNKKLHESEFLYKKILF